MSKKQIKTGMLFRDLSFVEPKDRAIVDVDNRTVELAFSSEMPVERFFGIEILSHDQGSVVMDRIIDGAPLLNNHNMDEQIGVVETVNIGNDRVGRAVVRFSRSQKAEEIFQDVIDGIRKKVSVGYIVHHMIEDEEEDDKWIVDRWEPIEISLVSIPADSSVGVGRALEFEYHLTEVDTPEEKEKEEKNMPEGNENKVDVKVIADTARKEELNRIREIQSIGDKHGHRDLANEFIKEGRSLNEFRTAVLEKMGTIKKVEEKADLGMGQKEVKEYSIARAIKALVSGRRQDAQYEFEVSEEIAKRTGKDPRGFFVPNDILKRDLTVGSPTAGGNLKATNLLASSFIEVLRNKLVIRGLGAQILEGLVGDVAIPSLTAATAAYWVAENTAPTEGAPTFGQATLKPKTVGAYVDLSRRLIQQSTPAIESIIQNDLAQSLAIAIDAAAVHGRGEATYNEPLGIVGVSGIGSVVGGTDGAAPTWAHIIDLESKVSAANADIGNLAYLTNAKARGKLKGTYKNATYGEIPIWENGQDGNGLVNGYKGVASNIVASNLVKGSSGAVCSAIIFGNWADLILGMWGALDINIDTATHSTQGAVRVVAFQDVDVAVRHAASFAAMLDVLTA